MAARLRAMLRWLRMETTAMNAARSAIPAVTIGDNSAAALNMVAVSPADASHGIVQYRADPVARHASRRPERRRANCSNRGTREGALHENADGLLRSAAS